jgi:tripartite-type tricarboxylate transporter receptor subunit TctC
MKYSGRTRYEIRRRNFLRLTAGAAALSVLPRAASALDYPTRPVRIIVGYGPGGPTDIIARITAQYLSEHLGQPFIVENRPGAGTNLATEQVVRAAPDGYTLLAVVSANTSNATLYRDLNFNFIRDIVPVASIVQDPGVMDVNPAVPAKTVPEFIAYAKANPGKLNMAAVGVGSGSDLAGELFKSMAAVDMVTVQYNNPAPALSDVIRGRVQAMFDFIPSSIAHIKAGEVRALAVTTAKRSPALPDTPTVGESIPGYEWTGWIGIGAPRNTPVEIVDRLNQSIDAALDDPKVKARLTDLGDEPIPMTPTGFGKLIANETEKWGKVIRAANIKPE